MAATPVHAISLSDRARESGCTNKPAAISDSLYKCTTKTGAEAFFNVPDGRGGSTSAESAVKSASPSSFPRVESSTQKSRDDMRKKVLNEELATEEKQLADARADFGSGAPAPMAEEKTDAERYRQRIERLRQQVQLHERNIDALKKELAR